MTKPKPIEIDLRRDLPKIREQLDAVKAASRACRYAAPCAIGAMIPARRRAELDWVTDGYGSTGLCIETLIELGRITCPDGQHGDLTQLQSRLDNYGVASFLAKLTELEAKYLGSSVSS